MCIKIRITDYYSKPTIGGKYSLLLQNYSSFSIQCIAFYLFLSLKKQIYTHTYTILEIFPHLSCLYWLLHLIFFEGGDFGISWNVYVYFCTFTSGFVSSIQCCIEQDWLLPLCLGRLTAEVWSDMWYPRTKQVGHINLYIIFGILLDTYLACIAFLKVLLCYIYTYIHYT